MSICSVSPSSLTCIDRTELCRIGEKRNFVHCPSGGNSDGQILEKNIKRDEEEEEQRSSYLNIDGEIVQFEILEKDTFDLSHFVDLREKISRSENEREKEESNHGRISAFVDDFVPDIVLQISDGIVDVQQRIPELVRIERIDTLEDRRRVSFSLCSCASVILTPHLPFLSSSVPANAPE